MSREIAPPSRRVHIIRILGTNADGDVLQDLWADVERIDIAKTVTSDENFQGLERKFRWCDDPNDDSYEPDGNPSRTVVIVKVCDPSSDDLENPDEWIPVPAVKKMRMVNSADNFQGKVERLINEEIQNARVVEKRRILHYDTTIDDDAQAAFDADDTLKVYVVSADNIQNYDRKEDTKDEDQYVEVEVVKYIKHRGNNDDIIGYANASQPTNHLKFHYPQGKQTKVLSEYLINNSEDAKLEELGPNDFNPPYRLDPFQNIINVNFGGAVKFFDGSK